MSRWARTRSASLTNELDNDDVLRRLRVLVVGDASAGKSTLLHRLEHGVEPSRSLAPTVGCNVVVIEVEGADADVEADEEWRQQHSMQPADRPYVELLDIGGSKEYATARPVFYTDRGTRPRSDALQPSTADTFHLTRHHCRQRQRHCHCGFPAPPPTRAATAAPRHSSVRRPRRRDHRVRRRGRCESDDVRHRAPGRAVAQRAPEPLQLGRRHLPPR
mmetsp:Transcript_100302/g.286905  ORF Transcript_100302/g.286905 Transcript_100302/m.286905 type:complete len:218 (-) Transcript_100302:100-753(-)